MVKQLSNKHIYKYKKNFCETKEALISTILNENNKNLNTIKNIVDDFNIEIKEYSYLVSNIENKDMSNIDIKYKIYIDDEVAAYITNTKSFENKLKNQQNEFDIELIISDFIIIKEIPEDDFNRMISLKYNVSKIPILSS